MNRWIFKKTILIIAIGLMALTPVYTLAGSGKVQKTGYAGVTTARLTQSGAIQPLMQQAGSGGGTTLKSQGTGSLERVTISINNIGTQAATISYVPVKNGEGVPKSKAPH